MAQNKNKPRLLLSVTSVEHVSPTAPPEPARPTSPPSSLLPQTQETVPPGAITALISSSSPPSSTHQERFPANPFLDLLDLSSAVVYQCGPQEATQPPTERSPAAPPPPDAAPVQWPAESNSPQGEDWVIQILCASFARLMAAGLGEEDAVKVLERSMPLQRSTIKKMQRMTKKRKERAALRGEEVSKNMRSLEEIFRAVKECVEENGGSTESDDGSSCGDEVSGGTGGDGEDGGDGVDTYDVVALVMRASIRLVLVLWYIFVVLVEWVVRSWFLM